MSFFLRREPLPAHDPEMQSYRRVVGLTAADTITGGRASGGGAPPGIDLGISNRPGDGHSNL